ncbi:curli production assembly/transport component CsgF [Hymenobacter sp. BT730]|uniref:curli production assembly/transport component CsgF n=1 Tax=Hymenobacter sp. BT730 TaxID=3063332 RepID=UPI0026E0DE1A|nr:curli production assembly/transport component CsgF [Hymenobacter sp. BT730]
MRTFFTKRLLVLGWLLFLGCQHQALAQDLVYEPKNPAFGGGNSFNYSWLLSSAQSQNKLEDQDLKKGFERDPLKDFEENLNQQILSNLARKLVASQFGESELQEGTYIIGVYEIVVAPSSDGVSVQVTDTGTGDQTTVVIPFY